MTTTSIPKLPSAVPLPISEDLLRNVVQKAKDWALMHGVAMRSKTNFSEDSLQFAPFILIPTAFPRKEFMRAIELQPILNELMHRVAHNRFFLTECLKETIQADEFTGNLFKIYETVHDEGINQRISLGLFRSDYMIHTNVSDKIKQVEFNTIASSLAGVCSLFHPFNRFVLEELRYHSLVSNLPANNALQGLCQGMLEAWKIYGDEAAAILFVVEDITYNICDQRFHEFELRRLNPYLRIIRHTLTEINKLAALNVENELIINEIKVAVIYFRSGYSPVQYPSQKEWDARLLMERSMAIKCPSIQYHLAGTKKVQQALAKQGAVEMFLGEASKIDSVKEAFTGLYSLDFDELGDQAIQMALDNPERYVLKPQREGGGNNIYGADIRDFIKEIQNSKERCAWILMERIQPPISSGYMIRPGGPEVPELVELVSELGIFGFILGDSQKIFSNSQVGHMLRTKIASSNEGGVAAGLGALDSPYLID